MLRLDSVFARTFPASQSNQAFGQNTGKRVIQSTPNTLLFSTQVDTTSFRRRAPQALTFGSQTTIAQTNSDAAKALLLDAFEPENLAKLKTGETNVVLGVPNQPDLLFRIDRSLFEAIKKAKLEDTSRLDVESVDPVRYHPEIQALSKIAKPTQRISIRIPSADDGDQMLLGDIAVLPKVPAQELGGTYGYREQLALRGIRYEDAQKAPLVIESDKPDLGLYDQMNPIVRDVVRLSQTSEAEFKDYFKQIIIGARHFNYDGNTNNLYFGDKGLFEIDVVQPRRDLEQEEVLAAKKERDTGRYADRTAEPTKTLQQAFDNIDTEVIDTRLLIIKPQVDTQLSRLKQLYIQTQDSQVEQFYDTVYKAAKTFEDRYINAYAKAAEELGISGVDPDFVCMISRNACTFNNLQTSLNDSLQGAEGDDKPKIQAAIARLNPTLYPPAA